MYVCMFVLFIYLFIIYCSTVRDNAHIDGFLAVY
jgi:hypothetical protein